jgi:hypothetical protein
MMTNVIKWNATMLLRCRVSDVGDGPQMSWCRRRISVGERPL